MPDRALQRRRRSGLQLALGVAPPAWDLVQQLVQAGVELLDRIFELLLASRRQRVEFVLAHGFLAAILERHESEFLVTVHQRNALAGCLAAKGTQRLVLACLQGILQRPDLLPVFIAVKGGGQRRPEFADKFLHVVAERPTASRRQRQQARLAFGLEVIDVAPVAQRALAGSGAGSGFSRVSGGFGEQPAHNRLALVARLADHEQVEALAAQAEAKT